jgi:hypothetical protein
MGRSLKLQIPNPKFQAKLQFPNTQTTRLLGIKLFGNFEFPWDLGFGAWDFERS